MNSPTCHRYSIDGPYIQGACAVFTVASGKLNVGVRVKVDVSVNVDVGVSVNVGVIVGVSVGVEVKVGVKVLVAVYVGVNVLVAVCVGVKVGVNVFVHRNAVAVWAVAVMVACHSGDRLQETSRKQTRRNGIALFMFLFPFISVASRFIGPLHGS